MSQQPRSMCADRDRVLPLEVSRPRASHRASIEANVAMLPVRMAHEMAANRSSAWQSAWRMDAIPAMTANGATRRRNSTAWSWLGPSSPGPTMEISGSATTISARATRMLPTPTHPVIAPASRFAWTRPWSSRTPMYAGTSAVTVPMVSRPVRLVGNAMAMRNASSSVLIPTVAAMYSSRAMVMTWTAVAPSVRMPADRPTEASEIGSRRPSVTPARPLRSRVPVQSDTTRRSAGSPRRTGPGRRSQAVSGRG